MMQKPCDCEFLYGKMTSNLSKTQINQALTRTEETQVVVLLYRKDGTNFLSNVLIAPVKNEKSQVILFILNFDELNETPDNRFTQGFHFDYKNVANFSVVLHNRSAIIY